MAYMLSPQILGGTDITERMYGSGATVTTSAITSCLVVAGRTAAGVIAIHLNVPGEDSFTRVPFAVADVLQWNHASRVGMLGEKSVWARSYPAQYESLKSVLGIASDDLVIQYGGRCTLTAGPLDSISVAGDYPFDLPLS